MFRDHLPGHRIPMLLSKIDPVSFKVYPGIGFIYCRLVDTAVLLQIIIEIMSDLDHPDDLPVLFPDKHVLGCRDQSLRNRVR